MSPPPQNWLIFGKWVSTSEITLCAKFYFKIPSHCWDIDTWSQTLFGIFSSAPPPQFHTFCHSSDNNCWSNKGIELKISSWLFLRVRNPKMISTSQSYNWKIFIFWLKFGFMSFQFFITFKDTNANNFLCQACNNSIFCQVKVYI